MTDLITPTRLVAAIKFKWQKGDDIKTYDYFVPVGLEVKTGDKVIVETTRGENTVEVIEVKTESELAAKEILRIAPVADESAPSAKSEEWNF